MSKREIHCTPLKIESKTQRKKVDAKRERRPEICIETLRSSQVPLIKGLGGRLTPLTHTHTKKKCKHLTG